MPTMGGMKRRRRVRRRGGPQPKRYKRVIGRGLGRETRGRHGSSRRREAHRRARGRRRKPAYMHRTAGGGISGTKRKWGKNPLRKKQVPPGRRRKGYA
jgi:hypothetical protein